MRKKTQNKIKNKSCCCYAEGNWRNINLLWNWVCSPVCILQTTLSLRANILFRGTSTSQRHLVEMIHVFLTAVGMNLSCSCLVNHDSTHEWRKIPCRYEEVASSLIIIIVFQLMLTISLCMNTTKYNHGFMCCGIRRLCEIIVFHLFHGCSDGTRVKI